jgi:uroporphyrinogen decarboxylase
MRQAGRYMAEYRRVRERHSFEEICKTPRIAAEVTASPVQVFDLDAAIIFSDILFLIEPFGFGLSYKPGPEIRPYLEEPDQADRFKPYDPSERLSFVAEAISESRKLLGTDIPIIGFSGAPFTIFSFLCGVKGARGFHKPYGFLATYPEETKEILQVLSEITIDYLKMQVRAGAVYVQLFDTFAGELSEEEFEIWARPYLKYIVDGLNQDNIRSGLFIRNSNHLLKSIADLDTTCFSVDWKTDITQAARLLKPKTLQGNLNPNLLLGPRDDVVVKTMEILESMKDYPGYIFNLGHGVLPDTPPDNVKALVETVHAFERDTDE